VYGREQLKFLHFIYVTNYGLMMAYVKPNFVAQIKRKKRSLVVYDTTLWEIYTMSVPIVN